MNTEQPIALPLAERIFMLLATLFIACLILTNVIAGKYFTCLGLPLSCSILVYPFTFVITDIISEVYGLSRAKMLVFIGFMVSIFITLLVWVANQLPIAAQSPIQAAEFEQMFGLLPGVVIGSMAGYLTAQFVDVQIFEYLRRLTQGKHLWIRNNLSTLTSQLLDTLIVVTMAWVVWPLLSGNSATRPISWQVWQEMVIGQYLFKALLALLDTPFVYMSTYLIEKWIGLKVP